MRQFQCEGGDEDQREYRIEIADGFAAADADEAETLVKRRVAIGVASRGEQNPEHGHLVLQGVHDQGPDRQIGKESEHWQDQNAPEQNLEAEATMNADIRVGDIHRACRHCALGAPADGRHDAADITEPGVVAGDVHFAEKAGAVDDDAAENDDTHADGGAAGDFLLVPESRDDCANYRVEQRGDGSEHRADKTHGHVGTEDGHRPAAKRGQCVPFGDFTKAHDGAAVILDLAEHAVP